MRKRMPWKFIYQIVHLLDGASAAIYLFIYLPVDERR